MAKKAKRMKPESLPLSTDPTVGGFGGRLQIWSALRGWDQKTLAHHAGKDKSTVSRHWRTSEVPKDVESITAYARAFGVTIDALLEGLIVHSGPEASIHMQQSNDPPWKVAINTFNWPPLDPNDPEALTRYDSIQARIREEATSHPDREVALWKLRISQLLGMDPKSSGLRPAVRTK